MHQLKNLVGPVIFLLLLLSGCTAASYAKAQRAFSRGTELRNHTEAGVNFAGSGVSLETLYDFADPEAPAGDADTQFRLAKDQLTKALKQKKKLRRDGLLANAYVLLALTELQLGQADAAKEQAAAARTIFNEDASGGLKDGGRDLAIAYAIDPIVTVYELYDSILILTQLPVVMNGDSSRTTLMIADFFARRINSIGNNALEGALGSIDFAISQADNSRETVQYLRNQEMAALLNNRRLLDKFLVAGTQSGTFRREGSQLQDHFHYAENRLDELVEDYRLKLLEVSPRGEDDPFYRFWEGEVF